MYKSVIRRFGLPDRAFVQLLAHTNVATFGQDHSQTDVETSQWKSVIGLEIHAQISSESKLFSGAGTDFGSPVNTNVSLFDAAIPGVLPVLNRRCVEAGVLTALALSCKINPVSLFDRKHYFYADLPAGYQITQQRAPLAQNGKLEFHVFSPGVHKEPYTKTSRIQQLQLEQDSGKSLHDEEMRRSLVDLNRAGIPLMELVFEPDLENGEEAAALVKELTIILQRLGTCSCKMEEGAMRVDANISLHRKGEPLGTRTEVKNIGSVRSVAHAIQFEVERQVKILAKGGTIVNETRSWDAQCKETVPMRDKEEKQDYRFMPEPNLPPLHVLLGGTPNVHTKDLINVQVLLEKLPELPEETRQRLCQQYGISSASAITLVNDDLLLQYFFSVMEGREARDSKLVSNLLIMDLLALLHKNKKHLEDCQVTPNSLGEITDLLQSERINLATAKKILQALVDLDERSPTKIMEVNGWAQITDPKEISALCKEVLTSNAKLVQQYQSGKKKVFNALVGEMAKKTQQRANMAMVVTELTKQLKT